MERKLRSAYLESFDKQSEVIKSVSCIELCIEKMKRHILNKIE